MAWPPTITVQAPHSPTPQPYLGPLMFNTSRSTHSRGISGDTSTVAATSLTVNLVSICSLLSRSGKQQVRVAETTTPPNGKTKSPYSTMLHSIIGNLTGGTGTLEKRDPMG